MNIKKTILCAAIFFSSLMAPSVFASDTPEDNSSSSSSSSSSSANSEYKSEIGLGLLQYDIVGSRYKGCRVNLHVFKGDDRHQKTLWFAQLDFCPPVRVGFSDYRTEFKPHVKLKYIVDEKLYKKTFKGDIPELTHSTDGFTYQPSTLDLVDLTNRDLITWRIDRHVINIQEVIDTVNSLKDSDGNFPKYKFVGYDYYNKVANCVTFSCQFLRAFGVNIDTCVDLSKWLTCEKDPKYLGYASYYLLGIGFLLCYDAIQPEYALKEINKNRYSVNWKRKGKISITPVLNLDIIEGAFGKGFLRELASVKPVQDRIVLYAPSDVMTTAKQIKAKRDEKIK